MILTRETARKESVEGEMETEMEVEIEMKEEEKEEEGAAMQVASRLEQPCQPRNPTAPHFFVSSLSRPLLVLSRY
jgi:hypothetical protein